MRRPGLDRSLAVLFAVNVLNFYDRGVLGALVEPIRREFSLSDTQIGALTTVFTLLYAVVGLPAGRAADTWSRKKLLALGVSVWAGLTAWGGLASSYLMLLLSRLGVAVGECVCAPAATSWIGDLFPASRRSRALALFMLGVPIGLALSFSISGPVAQARGWRTALVLAALPAVALVPLLLTLREPERGAAEAAPAHTASAWSLLRIPTLWWIIASGALVNFNLYALSAFLPAFLTRFHGLSVGRAGFWAGVGSGVAGVAGGLVAGAWGDRAIRRRPNGRMLAAGQTSLLAAPAALCGIAQPAGSASLAIWCIMAAYGLLNMYYGFVYASIHDIVAPRLRGTTMALYFLAMYLCGAAFGPLITGRLSDFLARRAAAAAGSAALTEASRAAGLHQAMYLIPALALALSLVLFAGARTIARDMARRHSYNLAK
ncbi:MAG TPA: MFS transporter [Bryobacteraceae bacterium]|nr:MFS transporter [Bryobacteraceae bacterium]